jgi:hypothetical protein
MIQNNCSIGTLVKLASAPTGAAHVERLDGYPSVLFKALR